MIKVPQSVSASWIRNFIFGVDDGLISTVGLLSGIAAAGVPKSTIILTGLVLIFVEAFSMGIGSFLSEQSAEEYIEKKETPFKWPLTDSVIMFLSYLGAGIIPLAPYFFFSTQTALWTSVLFSLITLFILGSISAKLSKINIPRHAMEMLIIGGIAILVGVIVGKIVNI